MTGMIHNLLCDGGKNSKISVIMISFVLGSKAEKIAGSLSPF